MIVTIKTRLSWIELYKQTNDFGLVCRRCGISRPTLRKWWQRYQAKGEAGLQELSRRPHKISVSKVTENYEKLILEFRLLRNLGARRIQAELIRHHDFKLSTKTIEKVLRRNNVPPLRRHKSLKKFQRYSRPVPGDRIQIDTTKIAEGVYQYTAIDDCSRFRVLGIYSTHTAKDSVHFLEQRMIEEFPFPIQRIQTDRGAEFFGLEFQSAMKRNCIKFRPIKPRSPHLNGKVERSQMTDKIEFYPTIDVADKNLQRLVEEWQFYYNWHRPHSSLGGKTPLEIICQLSEKIPFQDEVTDSYNQLKERVQERNYKIDLLARKVK